MNTIDILEHLVKEGTEKRGESLCIMYDERDGFFLSTVETGCHHYPVKELDLGAKHDKLSDAINAAALWYNKEASKPYSSFLTHINMPELKIKKLSATAKIPTKAHDSDLGYDIFSDEDVNLYPLQSKIITTNIAIGFPKGWGGFIKDRSSMAGKSLVTSGGVIDEAYTGPISILLTYINPTTYSNVLLDFSKEPIAIKKGDKIAQLVLIPTTNFPIVEVDELGETDRGEKGFGSSGA